ncbi:MAG: cytidine deaminase [Promethearchaeota archaeon]
MTGRILTRNPTDDELIEQAKLVQGEAYAPYSNFKVGAAILSDDGRIFLGCNVENASYGATICAERNAVANGVSTGARRFKKLAIVTDQDDPVMPCGICRQVLFEFSPDLVIISVGKSGKRKQVKLKDLLPFGFRLENPK